MAQRKTSAARTADYDEENDVLYVQFSVAKVARTRPFGDLRLVDYDAQDRAVGIEFIAASEGLDVSDLPLGDQIEALLIENGLHFNVFA